MKLFKEKDGIMEAIITESKEEGPWEELLRGDGPPAKKRFSLTVGIR